MAKRIKLAVVDDQRLFRDGLVGLIKEEADFHIIIEAENGLDLLTSMKRKTPDVVLLDLEMPVMDGSETLARLRNKWPDVKVIILTMHDDDEFIIDLTRKGANGYLLKNNSIESVCEAIYGVMEKDFYNTERITQAMLNDMHKSKEEFELKRPSDLTSREKQIIRMICEQKTNKEICDCLSLSIRTIEKHRDRIFLKTKTKNVAGLVMFAVENRLLG